MARLNLPTLRLTDKLVDSQGQPAPYFLTFLNGAIKSLQAAINGIQGALDAAGIAQAAADLATTAAANADAAAAAAQASTDTSAAATDLANSYVTGLTMTATDAGTNVTITISAHSRVYGDGTTVAVSAGSVTGLPYSTIERVYYDQPSRAGGTVSYQATTSASTAAQTGDRHSVGAVTTPAALGSPKPGRPVLPPGYVEP